MVTKRVRLNGVARGYSYRNYDNFIADRNKAIIIVNTNIDIKDYNNDEKINSYCKILRKKYYILTNDYYNYTQDLPLSSQMQSIRVEYTNLIKNIIKNKNIEDMLMFVSINLIMKHDLVIDDSKYYYDFYSLKNSKK